jgi:hypothetical protein
MAIMLLGIAAPARCPLTMMPQLRAATSRPHRLAPVCPTHRVTAVLVTPANHNYPTNHLPEARVAASCTAPSNQL